MSSTELEKHLVLKLHPSKILLSIVIVINLLALIVILLLPMGFQYKFVFVILICTNCIYFFNKYGWLIRFTSGISRIPFFLQKLVVIQQPIVQIRYKGDNEWQLQACSGKPLAAKLSGSSYSGLNFVILKFKISNVSWLLRTLSVVIIKDGIDSVSFRHLRIHLRLTLNPT